MNIFIKNLSRRVIFFFLLVLFQHQIISADPWTKILTYWQDQGGKDIDYCNTEVLTLYARTDNALYDYQWYKISFNIQDGVTCLWTNHSENPVPGAIYNYFTPTESGKYRCGMTNGIGITTYTDYVFIYRHSPGITIATQLSQTLIPACAGDNISLTFRTVDDMIDCQNRTKYSWQVNDGNGWNDIAGATSYTYQFAPDRDERYRCYSYNATSTCGNVYSDEVEIDFSFNPTIIQDPGPEKSTCEGISTGLAIEYTGNAHQIGWQFKTPTGNWTTIGSEHTVYSNYSTTGLTINTPSRTMNNYQFRCIIRNTQCNTSDTSTLCTLKVKSPPEDVYVHTAEDTKCLESTYTNFVTYNGTEPMSFRWMKGTTERSTSVNLSIPSVIMSDAGIYKCYLTNECGSNVSSDEANLIIKSAPAISIEPLDQVVCESPLATVQFSTTVNGDDPVYEWEISEDNGNTWSPLTNTSTYAVSQNLLQISGPTFEMDGHLFQCNITGFCPSPAPVTTRAALLTVKDPVEIFTESDNNPVCEGIEANLSVQVSGSGPILYQWQKRQSAIDSWKAIAGENSSTLSFIAHDSLNNHQYRCHIEQDNQCNKTVNTTPVLLAVYYIPEIQTNPGPKSICEGNSTSFSTSATGTGINYQWQVSENNGDTWTDLENTGVYSNVWNPTLNISTVSTNLDQNLYRCMVTGNCNPKVASNTGLLTVLTGPEIIQSPTAVSKCTGESLTLSIVAVGTDTLKYKWRKNQVTLHDFVPGANTYTINSLSLSDAGQYDCIVKNLCNPSGIECEDATVVINSPPVITANPESENTCEGSGEDPQFSASVAGGSDLLWQVSIDTGKTWSDLSNNAIYSGVTTGTVTVSDPSATMNQYRFRCKVAGICDPPVTSQPAILTIKTSPVILTQPVNESVCSGESISFSILAESTEPLEYKWKKGGKGITDWLPFNSITIDEVFMDDDGEAVLCLVRNECVFNTPVETDEAIIKVWPPPTVNLGTDRHLCPGDSIILDPGSGYASYEWNTGALTRTLTVLDGGAYKIIVSNEQGCLNDDKVYIQLDPSIPFIDLGGDRSFCAGEGPTLDAGTGYDVYEWQDGSNGQTYKPAVTGTYWVTASNNNTVCEVSDTVDISIAEPFAGDHICIVTVDLETGKNMVVWEKEPAMGIVAYKIYRETTIWNYVEIATIPYDNLSIFTDMEVSPETYAYLYKIQAIDTCSNATDLLETPYHKPIFLSYQSSDDGVNLTWTNYEIQDVELGDYLTSFQIFRGSDSTDLQLYEEVGSGNNYRDRDPTALVNKYWYRVAGVLKEPCYPTEARKKGTGPYHHSLSNMDDNKMKQGTGINETSGRISNMLVYPNPMKDNVTVRFHNPAGRDYTMYITDISGKIVRITKHIRTEEIKILRDNLKSGYYHIELVGNYSYRAKLIIE